VSLPCPVPNFHTRCAFQWDARFESWAGQTKSGRDEEISFVGPEFSRPVLVSTLREILRAFLGQATCPVPRRVPYRLSACESVPSHSFTLPQGRFPIAGATGIFSPARCGSHPDFGLWASDWDIGRKVSRPACRTVLIALRLAHSQGRAHVVDTVSVVTNTISSTNETA
jgi:hypothetical protein